MAERVRAQIRALMPPWSTSSIHGIQFLSGGYSNANYRFEVDGEAYVVRIPQRSQPFVDRALEQDCYDRIPCERRAELIAFDQDSGCLITRWVEGRLLIDARSDIEPNAIIRYVRELHAVLPHVDRTYDPGALYGYTAPPRSSALMAPCHNDLNPWNVIVAGDRWITLDWEFVARNDPLFDLVALCEGLDMAPGLLRDLARALLDDAPSQTRLLQVRRGFWLRELGWAEDQWRRGNRRPEIGAQRRHARSRLSALGK